MSRRKTRKGFIVTAIAATTTAFPSQTAEEPGCR